ncbi:hyaluronoglucuronidase-like [Biomphalaria glabrata]|uniref:Hyaluronoglucuronidase-like n=1 Tax=Biomphalaria glabrata TaxID=6526 RepID=A0A9U8E4D5_BIOGL|nr:hyaluronoglucuronidase-like [Biomphalaria glabrata]
MLVFDRCFIRAWLWLVLALSAMPPVNTLTSDYQIKVRTYESNFTIPKTFIAHTFTFEALKWNKFRTQSEQLHRMAAALSPSTVRLYFSPVETAKPHSKAKIFKHDGKKRNKFRSLENWNLAFNQFEPVYTFFKAVGWDVMVDFTNFKRKSGLWNTIEAKKFLDQASASNLSIRYFQIGSETNAYPKRFNITASVLLKDLKLLKILLAGYPLYDNAKLVGPDVTCPSQSLHYLKRFLTPDANVLLSALSFHCNSVHGNSIRVKDFLNITVLDRMEREMNQMRWSMASLNTELPLWLTETATFDDCDDSYDSLGFITTLLWLDKLGLAAHHAIDRVYRHTFWGGDCGLLDERTYDLTPEYYVTYLYKSLIEGPAFEVERVSPHVRMYAACARKNEYPDGALVVYALNIKYTSLTLKFDQFNGSSIDAYIFTSANPKNLFSRKMKLNDGPIVLKSDYVPDLQPVKTSGNVSLEPYSFAFFVIAEANVTMCKMYDEKQGTLKLMKLEDILNEARTQRLWTREYLTVSCLALVCLMGRGIVLP